jgi:tartrate dehydratase beta subunit/fumarate hydratase class I family protein
MAACLAEFAAVFTLLLGESTESKRGERVAATPIVMTEQSALKRSGPCTQNFASQYTFHFLSYHTSQMFVSGTIMQETVVALCHPISSAMYVRMIQGSRTVAAEKGKIITEGVCGG